MTLCDLKGKTALITGVSDDVGFAWHIAKGLQSQGAEIILCCHPRVMSIVERFLTKDKYAESRKLACGGELSPKYMIACDVAVDTKADLSPEQQEQKGYDKEDVSIAGLKQALIEKGEKIDCLIHSVAFSPEIDRLHLDVSRKAYLTSMSVSSYSLVALCRALVPVMEGRKASVIALSYLAGERAVPFYGGGMASAKAALECDARMLSWQLGALGHRINIISAGPYASRAARSIGDMDMMIQKTLEKSPLRRAITPEDVAQAAVFFASDLSTAITGETLHVDAGFHAMALV